MKAGDGKEVRLVHFGFETKLKGMENARGEEKDRGRGGEEFRDRKRRKGIGKRIGERRERQVKEGACKRIKTWKMEGRTREEKYCYQGYVKSPVINAGFCHSAAEGEEIK